VPQGSNFIAAVVQRVGPAVVRIDSERTVASQRSRGDLQDPFERFFGGGNRGILPPSSRIQEGTGSGFIIDANGVILTNAHVVDGADRVTVVLTDGRRFEGKVLGEDLLTDVAVVKIEANNLPTVSLGNSDQLQPGEWAIAIGNPLGLDNSVTVGIVSATGRSSADIGVSDRRVGFIQTDAAINPGNSGGPLLNQQGEVIGMNTAIISGAQGLGFAVPINTVQRIANELVTNGRVDHPYLGIEMVALTPAVKEQINADANSGITVQEDQGVLIVRVVEGSPAAQAGLRAGDVVVKIGNQAATDESTIQRTVESSKIGEDLPIEIRRNGQTLTIAVQPAVLPDQARS
jgi:S1-C subfamily serine protease